MRIWRKLGAKQGCDTGSVCPEGFLDGSVYEQNLGTPPYTQHLASKVTLGMCVLERATVGAFVCSAYSADLAESQTWSQNESSTHT